jgi:WD40 repeat protein
MSYCLNPDCQKPQNPNRTKFCQTCGTKLLLAERYRAIKPIAQGGFGRTLLAEDEYKPSKPQCVIKQFYPQGQNNAGKAAELFQQEAVRLEQLGKHPQIPELFAHFEQDNRHYIVQEFIDGQNLAGQEISHLKGHSTPGVYIELIFSLAFSPDGKILASGSKDCTIKLWEVSTEREISTLKGHRKYINSVAFSPDGKILASGSKDKTIKLWDVRTGREITTLWEHSYGVSSVAFSPDGKTLASSGGDKTIKLWDVRTGQKISTLNGHLSFVSSVAFTPDGKTLASSGGDKTIKLWDACTGQEISTLEGHSDVVDSVAFSPDGQTLASGSWDTTIKIWLVTR